MSGIPKYKQTAMEIVTYIRTNKLTAGKKLPGGRRLIDMFGVSKNTVYEALSFLSENKIIEIREKAGCFVARKAYENINSTNWDTYIELGWQRSEDGIISPLISENKTINLCAISAHESFGYYEYFLQALDLLINDRDKLPSLQNIDPQGSLTLRKYLADNLKEYGIETCPSNIIINTGVESSVDVFVRSLLSSGDTIYTEEPAAFPLYTLASSIGVNIVAIPMDEEGIDISLLKQSFRKSGRAILLVTSFCQIPTGINMSIKRRGEVLDFCEKADIPLIEIDVQWYPDKKFTPIRAMDKSGSRVLYSRGIFMPVTLGINIGWVVVPDDLVARIAVVQQQTVPYPFSLDARIVEYMFYGGLYSKFIEQLYPKFEYRRCLTHYLLTKYISGYASWHDNRIVFWILFENNIDITKFFQINKRLIILNGTIFGKRFSQYILLLPYAVSDLELEEGLRELAELIKQCVK